MPSEDPLDYEDLIKRQKSEKKLLTGEITALKKQITKKNKKAIQTQINDLNADLNKKHQQEIREWKQSNPDNEESQELTSADADGGRSSLSEDFTPEDLLKLSLSETIPQHDIPQTAQATPPKKRNRQKERLAKRNAKIDEIKAQALDESRDMVDYRQIEIDTMNSILALNGLTLYEIAPDGNCLFNSIGDQLEYRREIKKSVEELRLLASDYIAQNPDDFIPFLFEKEEQLSLEDYCDKLVNTKMWGSDIEVLAFSKIFDSPIDVYMAGSEKLQFNPEAANRKLILGFYKHNFGLGEHYNSLRDN